MAPCLTERILPPSLPFLLKTLWSFAIFRVSRGTLFFGHTSVTARSCGRSDVRIFSPYKSRFSRTGSFGGFKGAKLSAIFTSKIDKDVWLEGHLPPPAPMQDIGPLTITTITEGMSTGFDGFTG